MRRLHPCPRLLGFLLCLTTGVAGAAEPVVEILDASGDGQGNTLRAPRGLAEDGKGNVYVAGYMSHNVFRVAPDGSVTQIIDRSGDGQGNELIKPRSLAADAAGNVYVPGEYSDRVFRVSPDGSIDSILGPEGDGQKEEGHQLRRPTHVLTGAGGSLYVAGQSSGNVFRIASDGSVSLVIDRPRHGLRRPNGLALDGKGNLFVADANTNAVFRVAASGEVVRIYDSKTAPQAARLRFPNGIGVDSAGNVYVAGNNSANVLRIEPDGATSEFIRARVDGRLLPAGAALVVSPDGTVFLARNGPGIWRASEPASAVRFLGRKVPGGFELTGPRNMLLDRRGRLLIAGVGTHNVLRVPPGLPAVSTQPVKPAAEETPEPAPAPGG